MKDDDPVTHGRLESYVAGAWRTGEGEGDPVANAATGAVHALIGTEGLDLGGALEWGRAVGGPALRAMTIHQRALMLKALGAEADGAQGRVLRGKLCHRCYASGILARYRRRDRHDADFCFQGPAGVSQCPRADRRAGRSVVAGRKLHGASIFSRRWKGVAIHINAYNFPVWGMLEKIAPSLIAGMPCLVKPATQTAYLTELVVRRMLETGLLPDGALQIVTGDPRDLLDHVTEQDVVTFTGSATTGQRLKAQSSILANSVRFTMEADSLNASVLGSDAGPGTPEFDLFVREVAARDDGQGRAEMHRDPPHPGAPRA